MTKFTTYQHIYNKLYQLIPNLDEVEEYIKLKAPGFMDLGVDILQDTVDYKILALSHYYKHDSGDMIPDPDMTVRIHKQSKMAEALTYQDMYRYDEVYDGDMVNLKMKIKLNTFMNTWLGNLLQQGHKVVKNEVR